MVFKVSDIVVIKGDENKELWEVTEIKNGFIKLKGKTKRSLMVVKEHEIEKADKGIIDLKIKEKSEYVNYLCSNVNYWGRSNISRINESRNNIFEIPGSILHIDTDKDYMEQCLKVYSNLNIPAVGYAMDPKEMPTKVTFLLKTYKPNILVITGHDYYEENKDPYDINSYVNSKYYAQTVMIAREYEKDYDKLMIFAGACSSFFEVLILSGANFASSPKRIEIEALDPAIVACHIALTPILTPIDLDTCIEDTISMYEGIGGIQTGGALKHSTFKNIRGFSKEKNYYNTYKHCINTLEAYGGNAHEYAKDICSATLGIAVDNMDCMYDCVVNKGLYEKNCTSYVCRGDIKETEAKRKVRIAIDPGHSSVGNIKKLSKIDDFEKNIEYKINFKVGEQLKEILEYNGFEVITSTTEFYETINNDDRVSIINEAEADLIIKLHCNRDYNGSVNGAIVLVPKEETSEDNLNNTYGNIILDEYCNYIGFKNRGVIEKNNLKTIYSSNAPIILLGMGFLTNEDDKSILTNNNKQLEVAYAIARGIANCFE